MDTLAPSSPHSRGVWGKNPGRVHRLRLGLGEPWPSGSAGSDRADSLPPTCLVASFLAWQGFPSSPETPSPHTSPPEDGIGPGPVCREGLDAGPVRGSAYGEQSWAV